MTFATEVKMLHHNCQKWHLPPAPWFPLAGERFGDYGLIAATPRFEQRNGLDVYHPRYFVPPKVGMNLAPHTMAMAALPVIQKLALTLT